MCVNGNSSSCHSMSSSLKKKRKPDKSKQFHILKVNHPGHREKEDNQPVNPYVNLTAIRGKSHLRLKSGLMLVELHLISNCSPFLRMTVSFSDSTTTGGKSGTGSKDQKQHYHIELSKLMSSFT